MPSPYLPVLPASGDGRPNDSRMNDLNRTIARSGWRPVREAPPEGRRS
jgi:hypothetical protein